MVPPIPCRDDFARVAQAYFFKSGMAVEVGTFRGGFAVKSLRDWRGHYYMLDTWSYRPEGDTDKNFRDDDENWDNLFQCLAIAILHKPRVHLMQGYGEALVHEFKNESLDWVFIDAQHTHEALIRDLTLWYPKVRPGGFITGDDYGDHRDTFLVPVTRFEDVHPGDAHKTHSWGVIGALREWSVSHGVDVHVTWLGDCHPWPAWYFIKPLLQLHWPNE